MGSSPHPRLIPRPRNRVDEALEVFNRAVKKYPRNLVVLVDASRALGVLFELLKADALLDRLAKLGAHNADLTHLAGQSYRMISRPEKEIRRFERVVAMTRKIPMHSSSWPSCMSDGTRLPKPAPGC